MFALKRTDRILGRIFISCHIDANEAAYKGLVCTLLEYGSAVWTPHAKELKDAIEKVQNRATRFATRKKWEYDWHSWRAEVGNPQEGERIIDSFCSTKV